MGNRSVFEIIKIGLIITAISLMSDACLGNQRFNIRNIQQNGQIKEYVDLKINIR